MPSENIYSEVDDMRAFLKSYYIEQLLGKMQYISITVTATPQALGQCTTPPMSVSLNATYAKLLNCTSQWEFNYMVVGVNPEPHVCRI